MRKLCILISVLLVLTCFPVYAFADDPEESPNSSGDSGDRLATQEEIELMEADMNQAANDLYVLLSDNGTRATPHDVNDVYNLLWNYLFDTTFMSHGSNYPGLMYYRLNDVRNYCLSISQSASSMAVKLNDLYDSINPDYDTTGISIYDQLNAIATGLTSVDPNDGILTAVEALVYIYSNVEDIYDQMLLNPNLTANEVATAISNALQATLNLVNQHLANIDTDLVTLQNNLTLLYSELTAVSATNSQFLSDFNNITWNVSNSNYLGYSTDFDGSYNIQSSLTQLSAGTYYFKFSSPSNIADINIFKFTIRGRASTYAFLNSVVTNVTFYRNNNTVLPGQYNVSYDATRGQLYIYFYNGIIPENNDIIFSITFDKAFYLQPPNSTYPFNCYYLNGSNIDFYIFNSYLFTKETTEAINRFVTLYASDDMIAAKEDQQSYEDQAIEDFTGSGSAAASGSDLLDIKSVSNTIKSGLASGGSVSNALAPFSISGGFWGWFSQSNSDNINNPSLQRRDDIIIDFYTQNNLTLQGLLNGGGD